MEIIPNSTVKLFKNVPLNADYHDTLWWANKGAQYSYFNNLPGKVFNQLTYVRKERNTIRLECKMEEVFDCNYMAFLNTNFVNKWFYAFVLDVNYINNETCEIYYQIDTVQTWFFEMEFEDCFIERQHSTTDGVGDNIVPENLGQYRYVDNKSTELQRLNDEWQEVFNNVCVILMTAADSDGMAIIEGNVYNGIYSGLHYYVFTIIQYNPTLHFRSIFTDGVNNLNEMLEDFASSNQANAIVSLVMLPSAFVGDISTGSMLPNSNGTVVVKNADSTQLQRGSLDGYTPKNNKLYTYPYNCIYCTSGDNNGKTLRIENLTSGAYRMTCKCAISSTPTFAVEFNDYQDYNVYDMRLGLKPSLQCNYASDSFKRWLSNEGQRYIGNSLTHLLGNTVRSAGYLGSNYAESGHLSMGEIGRTSTNWIADTATSLGDMANEIYIQSTLGNTAQGVHSNDLDSAFGTNYPHSYQYCYDQRDLKRIDDFFTMYGYAQGTVGKPNLHARSKWTYVKTKGCQIHGQMPTIVQNELEGIFNNGVRFWTSPNYIGNYDQSNNVL